MAIGTTAAILGSAALSVGGSLIAGSKNNKAIRENTQATVQSNREALALQKQARDQNVAFQQPIYNAGLPAMQARNALLGLGGPQAAPQAMAAPPSTQQSAFAGYRPSMEDFGLSMGRTANGAAYITDGSSRIPPALAARAAQNGAFATNRNFPGLLPIDGARAGFDQRNVAPPQSGMVTTTPQSAQSAFDNYLNSTGYQFRFGEGMDALNSGFAARGVLDSGAARKAAIQYGQDFASNEFGNYMGYLGQQQGLTVGAANALSGVNTAYANNAGNITMANGRALGDAAIARANNTNAMIGGIGGALGGALGYFGQSSYGGGAGGAGGAQPIINSGASYRMLGGT